MCRASSLPLPPHSPPSRPIHPTLLAAIDSRQAVDCRPIVELVGALRCREVQRVAVLFLEEHVLLTRKGPQLFFFFSSILFRQAFGQVLVFHRFLLFEPDRGDTFEKLTFSAML